MREQHISLDLPYIVRKAAVLGAGVMGAQIAAHLANANVEVILFELSAKEGNPNANVQKALDNLKRLEPSPMSVTSRASYIRQANYDQNLDLLRECDIVVEAISERMDWKMDLYGKVVPHLGPNTIFASNTSGLSINRLAQTLPENVRQRFCGVHFFNPPRYMHLVEVIRCETTNPSLLDRLEKFLVTTLGKGVIHAKDTPNFIANRIGVFGMLATMHYAQKFGLGFDVVDALTGPLIGRPKSATFRTADLVGLDTLVHVVNTLRDALPDDPWHKYYDVPPWLKALVDSGALGQKTRVGVYRKVGKEIHVLDPAKGDYHPAGRVVDEEIRQILKNKNIEEKFAQLFANPHPHAQFLWAIFRELFQYCAVQLEDIADNARDVDLAMRWGFGWQRGPFETWQAAGWSRIAGRINENIAAGKTLATVALPEWVREIGPTGVHRPEGSYSPAQSTFRPRSTLAVYRRQLFPDSLLGEERTYGTTIFETDAVRMWHTGDDIAIVSFKSKMHTIDGEVLEGVLRAIEEGERNNQGLVIWQTEAPFSLGANLTKMRDQSTGEKTSELGVMVKKYASAASSLVLKAAHKLHMADALMADKLGKVEAMIARFQETTQALKYSAIPTVAAVDGMALGGGCEFAMHCDRVAAALESYIGLVEAGVGLLPGGGGCKELAFRAVLDAKGGNAFPFLQRYFEAVARAQVSKSADHAKEIGYLRSCDKVVMNRFELLYVAKAEVRALAEAGYRPPLKGVTVPAAGRSAVATFKMAMTNMLEGGFISEHDYFIGSKIAHVLCGGDVEAGSLVDEQWYLDLEREAFIELLATEKTQARIEYTLKTGKPLRN
ncbi:MAG TPA: 3-hydroxyacyl-CoA dehydrogenase/enoyl-CoA hydratase family protein [Burkholderiales bacterium]|nr:3-hydroxyacyl-CoA dehydrogenase/enoyl-CoA hydratase family protein [Burkholderiales bacterium]